MGITVHQRKKLIKRYESNLLRMRALDYVKEMRLHTRYRTFKTVALADAMGVSTGTMANIMPTLIQHGLVKAWKETTKHAKVWQIIE